MCLNCGCGEPDTRHKDSDLVREDLQRAADGQGSSMDETVGNLESSLKDLHSGTPSGGDTYGTR
jgi:hypothetical protein